MATIDKKAIRARFAEFWPALANVKLKTTRAPSMGPAIVDHGVSILRTTVYMLGKHGFTGEIVPIRADVNRWAEIDPLIWDNQCGNVLFNLVVIEVELHDNFTDSHSLDHYLRPLYGSFTKYSQP